MDGLFVSINLDCAEEIKKAQAHIQKAYEHISKASELLPFEVSIDFCIEYEEDDVKDLIQTNIDD